MRGYNRLPLLLSAPFDFAQDTLCVFARVIISPAPNFLPLAKDLPHSPRFPFSISQNRSPAYLRSYFTGGGSRREAEL